MISTKMTKSSSKNKRKIQDNDDDLSTEEDMSISIDKDQSDSDGESKTSKKISKITSKKETSKVSNKRQKKSIKIVEEENEYEGSEEVEDTSFSLTSPGGSEDEINIPPEAGQILEVEVENFMCHRKFSMKFGRHVNFITGRNGSGKSAIVSAIQLCLGATAKNTGRGNKLDGFIREGSAGPAIARVTLRNDGSDAYKPEIYGKRIIIERKINRSGQSGYTLYKQLENNKSKNGLEVVSYEKQELEGLLRNYNIYIDNPCCVLTQEEAKKFIQGHEKEKYEFFLKATGLQRTKEELSASSELITKTTEDSEKATQSLELKEKEKKKLEDDMNIWNTLKDAENDIKFHRAKVYWAQVNECNYDIKEVKQNANIIENELNIETQTLNKLQNSLNNLDSLESIQASIQQTTNELETVKRESDEKNKLYVDITKQESTIKISINKLKHSKNEFKQRLDDATNQVRDLRNRALQNATDSEERNLLEEIEDIDRKINEIQMNENKSKDLKSTLVNEISKYRADKSDVISNIRMIDNDLRKLQQDKTSLSSDNANGRLTMFGRNLPNLLNQISKEVFRGPVIGPIGMHVKIKDGYNEMSQAIETALGGQLFSFIVTNMEDSYKLKKLMNSNNENHTVIIQPFKSKYNINKSTSVFTVIDAVTIENDIVYNAIIDQSKPEVTAIARDENDAKSKGLIVKTNGKEGLPQGISKIILYQGNSITYRYGNQAYFTNTYQFRRLLSTNTQEAINSINDAINIKNNEKVSKNEEIRVLDSKINKIDSDIRSHDSIINNAYQQLTNLKNRKKKIDNKLIEIKDNQSIDTTSLEQEIDELKDGIKSIDIQIDNKNNELQQIINEVNKRKADKNKYEIQINELTVLLNEYENNLSNYINKLSTIKSKIIQQQKKLDSKAKEYEVITQTLTENEEKLNNLRNEAIEQSSLLIDDWNHEPIAIHRNETSKEIIRIIKVLENDLKNRENEIKRRLNGKTKESIEKNYDKVVKDYNKTKESLDLLIINLNNIKEDYVLRTKAWVKKLKSTTKTVNEKFNDYLNDRGMKGSVKFNHNEKLLHITCQTDNRNDNTTCQDVRQLSGGERSYTTLCLLLALGHVIECPFRLMDEYDVFLDEKSRNLTLSVLQDYALKHHQYNRQFFIITPHNLRNVTVTDKIRIFEMPAPIRNTSTGPQQTTLQF